MRLTNGDIPILTYATAVSYQACIRVTAGEALSFGMENGRIFDFETNSSWDIVRGLATDGVLRGQALQSLPSMIDNEDHWLDFYPNSTFWEGEINNE